MHSIVEDYKRSCSNYIRTEQNNLRITKNRHFESKLKQLDISSQSSKLENILELIDCFDEKPLQEPNATLKLIIDKIVFTKTAETNLEPIIDIYWREL
ncbi:hypothetical protein DMO16_05385 [Fictibacillus sp. S7]|nr:hypothetical protein DMO16_05385 [Fictibacillus sp. S7]